MSTDQPHLFNISLVYRTPDLKGANSALRTVAGGWTIAGSAQFQSGNLLAAPTASVTNVFVQSTGINPSKPTQYWAAPTAQRYFNTCTVNAATGARTSCLGTDEPAAWILQPVFGLNGLSPRFSAMRAQRPPVADLAISKTFPVKERLKLELHEDAFNLTNPLVRFRRQQRRHNQQRIVWRLRTAQFVSNRQPR